MSIFGLICYFCYFYYIYGIEDLIAPVLVFHGDVKIFLYKSLIDFLPITMDFINVYVFFFYAKLLFFGIGSCCIVFYFFFALVEDIFTFIKKD